MKKEIKSSKEVLESFFKSIKGNKALDIETVTTITDLYEIGKLSKIELTNALFTLREKKKSGEAE